MTIPMRQLHHRSTNNNNNKKSIQPKPPNRPYIQFPNISFFPSLCILENEKKMYEHLIVTIR